jgi:signal transduction histidine kinase
MKRATSASQSRETRPSHTLGTAPAPSHANPPRLHVLASVTRRLSSSATTQDMLAATLEEVAGPLGLDFCICYLLEHGEKALRLTSQVGVPETVAAERQFLDINGSFCGQVVQQREHRIEEDVQQSSDPYLQQIKSLGVRWYACFPLILDGRLLGTLSFGSRERDRLAPEDVEMLQILCQHIALAIQLKRTDETIRDLNAALDRRVEEQMEGYTYSVTHDLRAPLRAIRGFAQALVEDYSSALDETGRDYLKRLDDGAARLDSLLHDLLQLSRLGRATVNLEKIEVEECLTAALQSLDEMMATSSARLDIKRPLPSVRADAAILQQILTQLISNAVKFVAPSVRPHVRIWSSAQGDSVRVWVGDNGLGIAPSYHERIFGVFERLHSTETYPGTGVGLALAAKGAARLGGKVGLESALGEGSKFWVELPKVPSR